MPSSELDFQRIARQAREFREQEEQRIAAEKEEEARQIEAKKEAEREKIAQGHEEYLEQQQGKETVNKEDEEDALLHSSSFDSKSSKPSPGTVKRRADWLRGLEKDAAARRRLEDEFIAMVVARRKANPNETEAECEAAVKAALQSSDDSRHSHSLHSMFGEEEVKQPHVFEMLQTVESGLVRDMDKEFEKAKDRMDDAEEAEEQFHDAQETIINQKSSLDDEPENISIVKNTAMPVTLGVAEPEISITTAENPTTPGSRTELPKNSNSETKEQLPEQKIEQAELQYGVEVDPRTQAMLTEDDLVTTGKTGEDFANISRSPDFSRDRNTKELVLEDSIPLDRKTLRRVKGSSKNYNDDDDDSVSEIVHKEAMFELPVAVTKDGLVLSTNTADLNMTTTIPPSRLGGRVSGRLEGRSSFGEKSNTASGSASLEYKASRHSRLSLGMIRGCEPHHPLITIGGRLLRHGSSIGVIFYHNAKFLHQMMLEHSLWSLSFRHSFRNSKWCLSSELSRRQELSLSLRNGNKLSGLIGWNLLKPKRFQARIDVRPKITEYRRAHLYCQWQAMSGPGVWNFGVSLVQNLHSQIATFGLGWRLFSTRGLEWVISWSRGNATIRIPIVVSKGLATNSTIGHSLYFSMVSYLIQEYIAEVWGWVGSCEEANCGDAEKDQLLAIRAEHLTKARKDAAIQKELMSRQARRKAKDEKERNGLIIKKAVYQIVNVEEWDVTIPLQFWVSRSTLVLTAGPKSQLLGFYDIAASLKNGRAMSSARDSDHTLDPGHKVLSWREIWCDILDWAPKDKLHKGSHLPAPTLSVWYEFKGRSYEMTIKDREELRLPAI